MTIIGSCRLPRTRTPLPRSAVYITGFLPAIWAFYLGASDALGANPINALERILGLWALRFLLLSLAVTPLRRMFRINLLRYRRALGLLAFYYASLHVWVYACLDHGFNWIEIGANIIKRPYVTLGAVAFVMFIPLAMTSNNPAITMIGGAAWAKLHRLVYLASIAAALHFLLVVKSWPAEPVVYFAITALLLAFRLVEPKKSLGFAPEFKARPARSMSRN